MSGDRAEQAERYGDCFEAQLKLARRMADITGEPFGEMVYRHTNIARRLALGVPLLQPKTAGWIDYARALEAAPDLAAQVAHTQAAYRAAAEEVMPMPGQKGFGCFAHERPKDGVVKIHFNNRDTDADGGPLARAKIERRRADLTAMLAHIRQTHPEAEMLAGRSWLYHLEAYRRLFPPEYVATRAIAPGPLYLSGTSTWGQLIDSTGAIRPAMRDALYQGLKSLSPDAPWRAFPLHPLAVSAPLQIFYDHFGV